MSSNAPRDQINVRISPALRERLEQLAAQHKTSLSGAIKAAVLQATKQDGGIPSEQEILELLGEQARTGNVSAMKELRAYHREQRNPNSDGDELDELTQRRAARAG